MRAYFLMTVAALALAGCQSEAEKRAAATGEVEAANASAAEVSGLVKAAAAKNKIEPGKWQVSLKIDKVETASGDTDQALKLAKALERDTAECRTSEQLKPFDVSKLEKVAGTCTFARMVAKGGKVDADVTCKRDGAPDTHILISGTTSPTGFDVRTENRTGTPGQPGYSLVQMSTRGKRLGGC